VHWKRFTCYGECACGRRKREECAFAAHLRVELLLLGTCSRISVLAAVDVRARRLTNLQIYAHLSYVLFLFKMRPTKSFSEFEIMLIAADVSRQIISKMLTPFIHSILTRLECDIPTQSSKISLTHMPTASHDAATSLQHILFYMQTDVF
jgi:hypothetical protein